AEQLPATVNSAVEFGIDRAGNGRFYDGHTGQSFAAAGGAFAAEGSRLGGELLLTRFGELRGFAVFKATLESDFGEDYADVLLQVDGRLPEGGAELFGIVKFRYFEQTGTSTPVLRAEGPFEFEMFIDARTVSSVASARVEGPGG